MKRYIIAAVISLLCIPGTFAQVVNTAEGKCGTNCKWTFDGYTLTISNDDKKGFYVQIDDYNTKTKLAPWVKKKLNVRKVNIGPGISRIGSCAFANMPNLQEVVFNGNALSSIEWGAFLNDTRLRTISLPVDLKHIGTIAFANCDALAAIKIPDQCRLGDQAFVSCNNLKTVELSPTALLGHYVFADEKNINGSVRHTLYTGEVRRVPAYINTNNCHEYGFAPAAIAKAESTNDDAIDYDYATSYLDSNVPVGSITRHDTYALIIGNQNYRFVSDVPYAIHDARVFTEYCEKTLGIPVSNIHIAEDATKQMILEEELQDWLGTIPNPEEKKLIVYYAGHGVPDTKNQNKAYLLPTDVRGTNPQRGIALEDFYTSLSNLSFNQTTVFLDACFSGVNRNNEGVTEGLRAVEIDADDTEVADGNLIVFSAAQGNETAQGYPEEGHGLFTFYLLQNLNNTGGYTTLGSLADYIEQGVSIQAPQLTMKKNQTPTTTASQRLGDQWRMLRL